MPRFLFLLAIPFLLLSCSEEPISIKDLKPDAVGLHGQVVVVMTQTEWDGRPGEAVRGFLEQPYLRLPQNEPMFSIVFQEVEAYEHFFRKHHTVIMVDVQDHIDYKDHGRIKVIRDEEANGQARYILGAKNWEQLVELCSEKGGSLARSIQEEHLTRVASQLRMHHSAELIQVLRDTAGVHIDMVKGYYLAQAEDDFTWLRKGANKNIDELRQHYYVYRTPYTSDTDFGLNQILNRRDSVLSSYVKTGAVDGGMITERRFEIYADTISHKGNFAVLTKGLWKIPSEFMGGPFVSLSFLDKESKNIITVEGNTYAPHEEKREFMRTMEAVIRSAQEL